MKSNAQIFREAADYIREHGWRRWSIGSDGGPRCALGALRSAVGGSAATTPERRLLSRRVRLLAERYLSEHHSYALMTFNDITRRGSRNGAHVIALFESLAFAEELKAAARTCTPATPTPETGDLVSEPQLQEVEA